MRRVVKQSTAPEQLEKFNANQFVLENVLFDKQLAFVKDPERFKVAVCSRRAGKTVACAAHLIHNALTVPNSTNIYITMTSTSGKRIIWREFKSFLRDHKLKAKINEIELSLTFANGSIVYIVGAKDASEIDKHRGVAMHLVYIDECQSFREYIQELIDDVIGPALIDYAGTLCLIGTPGPVPTGYFYDCAVKSTTWSKHFWTFWDNPFIPLKNKMTHQAILDQELRRRGVTIDDSSIQREWFGQWKTDVGSLLIKYDSVRNNYAFAPSQKMNYVLGVDVGYQDADAIAVLGWSDASSDTYLIEEIVTRKQGITELAEQIKAMQTKYDVSKIIMDMGALGKKIGEELIKRYLIPVEAADKTRKMENIELLNDALRTGKFKAKPNSMFAKDSYLVEIDRDKTRPDRIVVSSRYHSDIIDAVLYAFKLSPAYAYQAPTPKLIPGTKEWAEAQQNDMFEQELAGLQQEAEFQKGLFGED